MGVQGVAVEPVPAEAPAVPGYELGDLLATGGTSEVWAGVAIGGGRRVAVKVVHADLGSVEAAAREASVSARAADAHVVAVEECVELGDGRVAVVMPHLRGGPLDALVRARGHLSPGEVVTALAPVASALGRLHRLGVVHGDVSPGNVLLDLDGRPVLGDLGLGHVVGDVSPGVWGTDGYVAPEVLLGADPTAASDVYSLGAVGWLCLSGTVPGPPGLRSELAEVSLAGAGAGPVVQALSAAVAPEPHERPGADELAWQLFAAAEPEPLRLVHGDDEVSAVTYRLRAAAVGPVTGAAPGRWEALRTRVRPARLRPGAGSVPCAPEPARPAGARGGPRHAVPPGRPWPGVQAVGWLGRVGAGRATGPLGILLLALLVLAVLGPGRDGAAALAGAPGRGDVEAATVSGASAATPSPAPVPVAAAVGEGDPRGDPDAPRRRPAELLAVLADARAAAWREATPALLLGADAAGSAAHARDVAAVAEVARSGVRYTGLRFSVVRALTVSASTGRAVLHARVDAGPYVVRGPSGATSRPAVPGEEVLVDLVRIDVGWRVADVRAVAGGSADEPADG